MNILTAEQRAHKALKAMEKAGVIGEDLRLDREQFLKMASDTWAQLGITGTHGRDCLVALEYLMDERKYFI